MKRALHQGSTQAPTAAQPPTPLAAMIAMIVASLLAVGLSGCSWLVGDWAAPTAGTSLAQVDRMTFSHKKHVIDEETECSECHGEIEESVSLQAKRQMPKEEACLECHDRDDDCSKCHSNPKAPLRWLDNRMNGIRFSHKAHLGRKTARSPKNQGKSGLNQAAGATPTQASTAQNTAAVTCKTCHAGVEQTTRVGASKRPAMFQVCGSCHRQDFDREGCQRCHTGLVDSQRRPLSLFKHDADWLKRHGTAAKGAMQVCAHCHTESSCVACHGRNNAPIRTSLLRPTAVARRTPHRGDWLPRHGIEARLKPTSCVACHQQSRCNACHDRMKVSAQKPGSPGGHPAGWMVRGSPEFHGPEARRAPLGCATCHDRGAASNCVTCHRVGGSGGTPHPPGWRSDLNKRSAPACAPCHP